MLVICDQLVKFIDRDRVRPDVGSSRNKIGACRRIASAIAIFCRMPLE